jgi:catalase
MGPATTNAAPTLVKETLEAFDKLNGSGAQPGYRPAHAKGILLAGKFTPSLAAKSLTRAPHIKRESTPVTVRFSDASGIPAVPDNNPNANPRGMAIRFNLAEHVHTDIIAHSVNGFPVRTPAEFVEFLRAIHESGPGVASPTPVERFLGSHPAALEFVQIPKLMPASFAKAAFYALNAYRFINDAGTSRYGRYRIRPDGDAVYLDSAAEGKTAPNFLFDEIKQRLSQEPVKMRIAVQVAAKEDFVNDATAHWPQDWPEIDFGAIELTSVMPDNDAEQRHIIFDPIPRVDGIEPSGDPLLEFRAEVYLMSGRRRRAEGRK